MKPVSAGRGVCASGAAIMSSGSDVPLSPHPTAPTTLPWSHTQPAGPLPPTQPSAFSRALLLGVHIFYFCALRTTLRDRSGRRFTRQQLLVPILLPSVTLQQLNSCRLQGSFSSALRDPVPHFPLFSPSLLTDQNFPVCISLLRYLCGLVECHPAQLYTKYAPRSRTQVCHGNS